MQEKIGEKKMPLGDSYQDYLSLALKDPKHSAAYIEAIMEEKDPKRELLKHALQDVEEAIGEIKMSAARAKEHYLLPIADRL